jgi:hypothetical protein
MSRCDGIKRCGEGMGEKWVRNKCGRMRTECEDGGRNAIIDTRIWSKEKKE